MFSRISTQRSAETYSDKIERLSAALADADAVIIGAGAGLSTSAGFDKKRLFYTQGDYGLFQCSEPCCQETFENESVVKAMMQRQKDMRVPSSLIPRCPHCGKPLTMNLRSDDRFVEDEGWHAAAERYSEFLCRHKGMNVLLLELGVGHNAPAIIKYPFWRSAAQNAKAVYACINFGQAACPPEIEKQSMTLAQRLITIGMVILGTMLTRFVPFVIFRADRPTARERSEKELAALIAAQSTPPASELS